MALVELGRPPAKHLLDGVAKLACALLAPLEIGDGLGKTACLRLELAAALAEEPLDHLFLLGSGGSEEVPEPAAQSVVGLPFRRPVLPVPFALWLLHVSSAFPPD